jgi:uncharacterized protein YjeT (DUF2065 family)
VEVTKIILLITGAIIFVPGFLITTSPDKVRNWLKEWLSLPDDKFCLLGYVLGLIGLAILIITILAR